MRFKTSAFFFLFLLFLLRRGNESFSRNMDWERLEKWKFFVCFYTRCSRTSACRSSSARHQQLWFHLLALMSFPKESGTLNIWQWARRGVTLLTCSLLGFSFIGTSLNQLLWAHHHVYSVNSKNMLVFFSPHYNILPVLQRHVGALQVWALLSFYINRTWVMRKIILALTFRLTFC